MAHTAAAGSVATGRSSALRNTHQPSVATTTAASMTSDASPSACCTANSDISAQISAAAVLAISVDVLEAVWSRRPLVNGSADYQTHAHRPATRLEQMKRCCYRGIQPTNLRIAPIAAIAATRRHVRSAFRLAKSALVASSRPWSSLACWAMLTTATASSSFAPALVTFSRPRACRSPCVAGYHDLPIVPNAPGTHRRPSRAAASNPAACPAGRVRLPEPSAQKPQEGGAGKVKSRVVSSLQNSVGHRGLDQPHLSFRQRELPAAFAPARP